MKKIVPVIAFLAAFAAHSASAAVTSPQQVDHSSVLQSTQTTIDKTGTGPIDPDNPGGGGHHGGGKHHAGGGKGGGKHAHGGGKGGGKHGKGKGKGKAKKAKAKVKKAKASHQIATGGIGNVGTAAK